MRIPICILFLLLTTISTFPALAQAEVKLWTRFEQEFRSDKSYSEPLYEVASLTTIFQSPSGRTKKIQAFWDGADTWKVRFAPDEVGLWTYRTECSDQQNTGLHGQTGSFTVTAATSPLAFYSKGTLTRPPGRYHLAHADGTPFFWFADTAWNGALKATDAEWDLYLKDRVQKGFNAIQVVLTQWRGADSDADGRAAFEGAGRIRVNPQFFQRLDRKIDRINDHGLVAALVLLWALPVSQGRHLSPGYFLPEPEAILLARYMVARYGGNQVVWFLGGDGKYIDEYEQRWKTIGRGVFGRGDYQGLVAQHPQGRSWIGEVYKDEPWLDIIGYQSSHSAAEPTVNWINRGPMAEKWDKLPARPLINLEPLYENNSGGNSDDVRKACYWSVFATPVAGITYGAHTIWPWLKRGEKALNHSGGVSPASWQDSLGFPGVVQVSYLVRFMQRFAWWELRPRHQELLVEQPGLTDYRQFVPALANDDVSTVLVYVPEKIRCRLRNPRLLQYTAQWFNPVTNQALAVADFGPDSVLTVDPPFEKDAVLVLTK
ncbi:MAG: DUF4038 domain-containing protein [Acidobacteria bacterium]|nr:MAG: DUF4038 domain-containing protein [Acidobacteriota bacterium]